MKESLEKQIYDAWHPSKYSTRYDLYDTINKVSRLKGYWENSSPIKLTPLNIEIAMNNRTEVLNLIRTGANVNKVNEAGFTPLIEAVLLNNYAISKILLENGANVNGTENFMPILIAAHYRNDLMIELLLKYGVEATNTDKNGFNALHHMFYDTKIQNLVSPIPPIIYSQLDFACNLYRVPDTEQTIKCIDLLVEHGLEVNYSTKAELDFDSEQQIIDLNPLSLVLENSNEEVLQKLIELGAERKAIELSPHGSGMKYFKRIDYIRKIEKYNIEVYSDSLDDGYKQPKLVKKY